MLNKIKACTKKDQWGWKQNFILNLLSQLVSAEMTWVISHLCEQTSQSTVQVSTGTSVGNLSCSIYQNILSKPGAQLSSHTYTSTLAKGMELVERRRRRKRDFSFRIPIWEFWTTCEEILLILQSFHWTKELLLTFYIPTNISGVLK